MDFPTDHLPSLVVLLSLLLGLAQCQMSTSTYQKAAMEDVFFLGAAEDWVSGSRRGCAVSCSSNGAQCESFSFQHSRGRCLLYSRRIQQGIMMSAAVGFDHYWRMEGGCPIDKGFSIQAGNCVMVSTDKITWQQAKAKCEEYGGHLYVGDTEEKMKALVEIIQQLGSSSRDYRVGAIMDVNNPGTWNWITGGRVKEELWEDGKAETELDEICCETVQGSPGKLQSDECNEYDRYICEMHAGIASP